MFFFDDQFNRRRTADVRLISAARIEMRGSNERLVHDVEMVDGTQIVLLDVTIQQIARTPAYTFIAQPGTYVWTEGSEQDGDFMSPVIGWNVTQDGNVLPLTPGGSIDSEGDHPIIVLPDGQVAYGGIVQASSLADYKASIATDQQ